MDDMDAHASESINSIKQSPANMKPKQWQKDNVVLVDSDSETIKYGEKEIQENNAKKPSLQSKERKHVSSDVGELNSSIKSMKETLDTFAMVFKQHIGCCPNELTRTRLCTTSGSARKKRKVGEDGKIRTGKVCKIDSNSSSSSDPDFVLKRKLRTKKEKLFCAGSPDDNMYVKTPKSKEFYIRRPMKLNKKATVVDSLELGLELPPYIKVNFKPTKDMKLDQIQVAVAAYIYGKGKPSDEILVKSTQGDGLRRIFDTIIPGHGLVDDVINLVCCMLTHDEDKKTNSSPTTWWMPTTFSQLALNWLTPPSSGMRFFQEDFMGKVETLERIYVPINERNLHWFLLVVDFAKKELIYLDSLKSSEMAATRRLQMKTMAVYIEHMLQDDSFYESDFTKRPRVSEFNFKAPKIGQQKKNSNDCGVWVSYWMIQAHRLNDYNLKIDDSDRMRLALDLVLRDYNPLKKEIIKLATTDKDKLENAHRRLVQIDVDTI